MITTADLSSVIKTRRTVPEGVDSGTALLTIYLNMVQVLWRESSSD